MELIGHPVSQPTRAVMWLLAIAGQRYELTEMNIFGGAARTPEFRAVNPAGVVPVLRDGARTVCESHAILFYLCQRLPDALRGWWPAAEEDLDAATRVQTVLHWHHHGARVASGMLFRPKAMAALGVGSGKFDEKKGRRAVARAVAVMETWLGERRYLATDARPSVADLAVYCEMDQLEQLALFDFAPYPAVSRWLADMKAVEHHDEVREGLYGFCTMLRSSL